MKYFPDSPWYLQAELLLTVKRDAEMLIRLLRNTASAGRSCEKPLLEKVRLIDIFQRYRLFVDRRRQRLNTDRAAVIVLNNAAQHTPIQRIETQMVNLQPVERFVRYVARYHAVCRYLCKIAYASENAVCNTRCTAAAAGNLICTGGFDLNTENSGAPLHDAAKLLRRIQFQPENDAEAVTQRRGKLTGAGRCADEREDRAGWSWQKGLFR